MSIPPLQKDILVYNDAGTSANCVRETLDSLRAALDPKLYQVKAVGKNIINHTPWELDTALLVMPGGRSKPFYADLGGVAKGNEKITAFVAQGGNYLGICAGGYYACSKTEFEIGQPLEIRCDGKLNFFQGTAWGPAYELGKFNYENNEGARLAKIILIDEQGNQSLPYTVYYNGGAHFIPEAAANNFTIIATYADIHNSPAAIVRCQVGKGIAVLTGIHPEYSYRAVETQVYPTENIYQQLKWLEAERVHLFATLLKQFSL